MHPTQSQAAVSSPNSRAWYGGSFVEFLVSSTDSVIGRLAGSSTFAILQTQRDTWVSQIAILRAVLSGLQGTLFMEFTIPRMGRRIDVVLIIRGIVFIVEFKVGTESFDRASIDQVWDYALDLKNFHEGSHTVRLVPVLVATGASKHAALQLTHDEDGVYRPILTGCDGLREVIDFVIRDLAVGALDEDLWAASPYHPTPTIVAAARSLYARHSVESIARSDAEAKNLHVTSKRIEDIVDEAREKREKVICFVTGVPGAGKTLVGLNIANRHRDTTEPTHAVFLSGNGPLVAVLREALTRDEVVRRKANGEKVRKGKVGESVKAFIQNVHHFRDEALADHRPPIDHVVVFDEAQRAWNLRQTANFMQRKKGRPGFSLSEPQFLISYMNRHDDWAVIVCLVGGGQEINIGEAGIDAWLEAVNSMFPHWRMCISSRLTDSEYGAAGAIQSAHTRSGVQFDDSLHLSVSMRSFRAENVSAFVKLLLDCERSKAAEMFASLKDRYPIVLTRNLDEAKRWLRNRARGSERFGLVASSKAQRLKPHAIDIRVDVDPIHWFLNEKEDTRSSYYLEDAATEFQVQGLELDWVCVTWDGDLRFTDAGWSFHDFRGDKWTNIANADNRNYLRNAYRVLLTRARQGMVLFIPPGEPSDPTRAPKMYDPIFNYLTDLGVPAI